MNLPNWAGGCTRHEVRVAIEVNHLMRALGEPTSTSAPLKTPPEKGPCFYSSDEFHKRRTKIRRASKPLFKMTVVSGAVTIVSATQTPLTEDNSAVDAAGNRSWKAMRRIPKTRVVDPVAKWTRMQPNTAPQPQPPSVGVGPDLPPVSSGPEKQPSDRPRVGT